LVGSELDPDANEGTRDVDISVDVEEAVTPCRHEVDHPGTPHVDDA
jgi:hypothetical protein